MRTLLLRICTTGEVMANMVFGQNDEAKIKRLLDFVLEKFPTITTLLYTINEKCVLSPLDKIILMTEIDLRKEYYKGASPKIPRINFIEADKMPIELTHPYTLVHSPQKNLLNNEWISSNEEFLENFPTVSGDQDLEVLEKAKASITSEKILHENFA